MPAPGRTPPSWARAAPSSATFVSYRVGSDVLVIGGRSTGVVRGANVEPLPGWLAGVEWEMDLTKDPGFRGLSSPVGDVPDGPGPATHRASSGTRRVRNVVGARATSSIDHVWLVTERGGYQSWIGEVWRRKDGRFAKIEDVGSASWTFAGEERAMLGRWKGESLLGGVHPYADNAQAGTPPFYRMQGFPKGTASPAPKLPPLPKDCVGVVYPIAFAVLESGEAFVVGPRCLPSGDAAAVVRWDASGKGPIVDALPSMAPGARVSVRGALVRDARDVLVFGSAALRKPSDQEPEPEMGAWLVRFDGTKWTLESAPPGAARIDHLLVRGDGTLVAIAWPKTLFERSPGSKAWRAHVLDPALENVTQEDVWLGADGELWVTGVVDGASVVLHERAAPSRVWRPVGPSD